jgi:hypothetical protein
VRRLAVVLAALVVVASAGAANPAKQVAVQLKPLLVSALKQQYPTLKVTFVKITCKLASNRATGRCAAYFEIPAARAIGALTIGLTIDTTTGKLTWKELAAVCKDSQTGQKLACF